MATLLIFNCSLKIMKKKQKMGANIKKIMSSAAFKVSPTSDSKTHSTVSKTGRKTNSSNKDGFYIEAQRNMLIMVI